MSGRFGAFLVAAVLVLSSVAARAADKPLYAPPEAWVQVVDIPAPVGGGESPAVQALLDDNQSRLTPEGASYYVRLVARIAKPEGLRSSVSRSVVWDPATETVTLHSLRVIRDGKTIDLLGDGRDVLVLRRETNLERAMLDGRLTATRQLEGLQVGDVIDWAYTRTRKDPVVKGRVEAYERLAHPGVLGRFRARLIWPDAVPIRWRRTEGLPEPRVTKRNGETELLVDTAGIAAPRPPAGAPPRFRNLGALEAVSYKDWAEVSGLMAPLYDRAAAVGPASAVRAEAAAIAARTADPKARAEAALALVQGKVRYLFLGMDSGGYLPASADETWTRRFGDCKAKTALLLALLRELKVEAEPVLVNTTGGDGLNERLPSLSRFNHILVRAAIGGRTYWLDGTRTGDASLERIPTPPFRWALPVRAQGAELVAVRQGPLTVPMMSATIRLDATGAMDAAAPARIDVRLGGDAARSLRQAAASQSRDTFERGARESFGKTFNWIKISGVEWGDEPDGRMRLSFTGQGDMDWVENPDLGVREFRLPSAQTPGTVYPPREPGPNSDAPYLVQHPLFVESVTEVVLPGGGRGYTIRAPEVSEVVGGLEIKRKAEIVNGVARLASSTRSVAPEVSAAEAMAANATLRRLRAQPDLIRAPAPG